MATRTRTTGKKKTARKKAASSSRRGSAAKKGGRKMASSSRKRGTARKSAGKKTSARKTTTKRAPVARVKRVAQEVVQQAQTAVVAGVETLRDLGENLIERVRES